MYEIKDLILSDSRVVGYDFIISKCIDLSIRSIAALQQFKLYRPEIQGTIQYGL